MSRVCLLALILLNMGVSWGQQLPPGTRQADDHSRENAASAAGGRTREAEAALESGDFSKAVTLLKALAAERPKDAHLLYDLGYAEERTGAEADAKQAYMQAIAVDASFAEPRVAVGLLDARAGRTVEAHRELAGAAALSGSAPELRGRALRALAAMDEQANPDAAREELLQAVKLTGETAQDVELSGRLASRAGDASGAERAYRRALAQNPKNAEAAASLAQILIREKKIAEAEALLQDALKSQPGDLRLVTQLASLYAQDGKAAEGIALLENVRAADAKVAGDLSVTRMLARMYALGDRNAEAAHLYEQLDKQLAGQQGSNPELLDDYGSVLVKQARFAEAEVVLMKAVAMREAFRNAEDWAEAAGHLAFAASRNHDPKVTLQALASRSTVLPNSPASLFLEATAHDSLRETKDAIKAYRAFLVVAGGKFPDQEFQARHRLVALEHMH